MKPIVLTAGEPAGIGPDLIVQLAQKKLTAPVIVVADKDLLQQRAKLLNLPLQMADYTPEFPAVQNGLYNLHVPLIEAAVPRQLNAGNAPYVLNTLKRAVAGCLHHEFAALVTGPVHKGIINEAGISFSGHTEFFAELTKTEHVVMMLFTQTLRVALVTTHLPLRAVADAITPDLLSAKIQITYEGLKKYFNITHPRLTVCGLNPHAGEQGYLGQEEIKVITPVLEKFRQQGFNLIGPVPADTAFIAKNLTKSDAVLTMYHDQGLPVLKHTGFEQAINLTLGLPFIRTSVDHGVALELAGSGKTEVGSLIAAIDWAAKRR